MRVNAGCGDNFLAAKKETIIINVYMAFVYHLALFLSQGTLDTLAHLRDKPVTLC